MSWQGKVLRVDLTRGTCAAEPLNMEWAQKYLGQRGLGSKYLAEEVDPMVDPLGNGQQDDLAIGPLDRKRGFEHGDPLVGGHQGALIRHHADFFNSGGFIGAYLKRPLGHGYLRGLGAPAPSISS